MASRCFISKETAHSFGPLESCIKIFCCIFVPNLSPIVALYLTYKNTEKIWQNILKGLQTRYCLALRRYTGSDSGNRPPVNKPTGKAATSSSSTKIDNTSYKVLEYYQHDEMTYVDLMMTMSKHRLPQPSSKQPT